MKKWILFAVFFAFMLISFIFDREILKFFGSLLQPNIFLFMYYTSHIVFFIAVALICSYLLRDKRSIAYFWMGISFTYIISIILKLLAQRVRPLGADLALGNLGAYSFPSSHATVYFFIFAFMAGCSEKFKYPFLALAVLVSLSRVYLGLHYLSDIIGGGLLGVGLYLLLRKWIKI